MNVTVRKLVVFFASIFLALSPAMQLRAQETKAVNETEAAQGKPLESQGSELQRKLETLEKDIQELKKGAEEEAGKKLEVTEEEKAEKEKKIVAAAGRSYTLLKKRTLELEYNFRYSYYSVERVIVEPFEIAHVKEHIQNHIIVADYAFFDNLTFTGAIPFVYKYERVGTGESKDASDVGDISFGFRWQPFKSESRRPTTILYGSISTPTGTSPYKINLGRQLSSGSGFWSCTGGVSLSKPFDPVVAFGSLSFSYNSDVKDLDQKYGSYTLYSVEPGNDIGFSMGIGYALSYNVFLTLKFIQNYHFESKYSYAGGSKVSGAPYLSSIFDIGTGWRINPKTTVFIGVGIGLTNNDPDFYLSFRLPFDF
jgi:hypothetical protein